MALNENENVITSPQEKILTSNSTETVYLSNLEDIQKEALVYFCITPPLGRYTARSELFLRQYASRSICDPLLGIFYQKTTLVKFSEIDDKCPIECNIPAGKSCQARFHDFRLNLFMIGRISPPRTQSSAEKRRGKRI